MGDADKRVVARNLKMLREFFGETQDQLCRYLGVANRTYRDYEGARTNLSQESIRRICFRYGVTESMLSNPGFSTDFANFFNEDGAQVSVGDFFRMTTLSFPALKPKGQEAGESFEKALRLHLKIRKTCKEGTSYGELTEAMMRKSDELYVNRFPPARARPKNCRSMPARWRTSYR